MAELTKNMEDPTSLCIHPCVLFHTKGGECKGYIILVNVLLKLLALSVITCEEIPQSLRWICQSGYANFALVTASTEGGVVM